MLKTILVILEKFIFKLTLSAVFPLFFFFFFWWGSYFLGLVDYIPFLSVGGLLLGVLINVLVLKSWIHNYLSLTFPLFTAVYIFYSLAVFGFFMGIPLFNLIPAVLGGYYYGRKLTVQNTKESRIIKIRKKVSVFTSAVMFFICALSALLALTDTHTGNNLKEMLGLNFEVTNEIIIGIIIIGAVFLILINYLFTYIMINTGLKIKE